MNQTFDILLTESMLIAAEVLAPAGRLSISKLGRRGLNKLSIPHIQEDQEVLLNPMIVAAGTPATHKLPEDLQWDVPRIAFAAADLRTYAAKTLGYLEFGNVYGGTALLGQVAPPVHFSRTSKLGNWLRVDIVHQRQIDQAVELTIGEYNIRTNAGFYLYSAYPDIFQALLSVPPGKEVRMSMAQEVSKKDSLLKILSRSQYAQVPV